MLNDASKQFEEIAALLRERQQKEAEIKKLDDLVFSILGVNPLPARKSKALSAAEIRRACGL